ncbi:MAG: glycoside hydrolase family 65 protein [Micrococcales bacterium]|nr:glycoside hydrolase family 65 protein [Micrococcales bacterium]
MKLITGDPLDRVRMPVEEWALVETEFSPETAGARETVFAVGNGFIGLRANQDEGRDGVDYGTYLNGFHETWRIYHPEEAFGFARVGQTIVNAPDAKVIRLYVDDEPFVLSSADVLRYTRRLDFRDGVLLREVEWRTPSGKRVLIRSRRMVSFAERHLAVIQYEVTVLDASASLLISSQIRNRQDTPDEYQSGRRVERTVFDPRKGELLTDRVLQARLKRRSGGRCLLGYQTTNSGMTLAVAADHRLTTDNAWDESGTVEDDVAKQVYRVRARPGIPTTLTKLVAYHDSRGVPVSELADRCDRTLDRGWEAPVAQHFAEQRAWLDDYWERSDIRIADQPHVQQAVRWNLFQLAQATARSDGHGVAAKGVTGSGYDGQYFWDTEIFVMPFLTYTAPTVARNVLRFRYGMLDAARDRARDLSQRGALFPWRTINGLESSAYYAAGTAQYHIDADVSHAVTQYVSSAGDRDFLIRYGIDILVETARLWEDLGFWRGNGDATFHIYGVTGPDEYTTVVNDNLYTNVMARANLRSAADACRRIAADDSEAWRRILDRLHVEPGEIVEWERAADAMEIPFDAYRGIHPQDAQFLDKEVWDLEATPASKHPLLMHYHPLVIYRFQVLKQTDVVLALLLRSTEFSAAQKRADFEYYDALTTGDSTLSAVVQSVIAAEVGYQELAYNYFLSALYVDLADLQGNTLDGVHVASAGGIWTAVAKGFAGLRDDDGRLTFDPRLPEAWSGVAFRLQVRGARVLVELERRRIRFTLERGERSTVWVRGARVDLGAEAPTEVALADQGPVLTGSPLRTSDIHGLHRSDGTMITASIPTFPPEPRERPGDDLPG